MQIINIPKCEYQKEKYILNIFYGYILLKVGLRVLQVQCCILNGKNTFKSNMIGIWHKFLLLVASYFLKAKCG